MKFVWPVLTFVAASVAALVGGVQYIGPLVLIFPAVVLGYLAFVSRRSYLVTLAVSALGLAVAWPWMSMLFRVMPDAMYALLDVSYESGKSVLEARRAGGPSMEVSHRLGAAAFSGIGVGMLLLVAGVLASARYGDDPARRTTMLRVVAVGVCVVGVAALFGPSTALGFGVLVAGVPGILMIWNSRSDVRATLRVLQETW